MKRKKNWYFYIKDVIIYSTIIMLLVFIAYQYFKDAERDKLLDLVTQYIGTIVTILLGVIGVIEFAFDNGLTFLVPNSFENYKENKLQEQTKYYLNDFFCREAEYFSQYSNSRITFLLNQLGLNRNEFDRLKMDILDIKLLPLHNLSDAQDKLKRIIKTGNIILTQDGKDSDELVYKEVKYFINFTDVMFVDDYFAQITDCLVYLIKEKTKQNNIKYNRVLISHSGNFLLGIGVSKKLNIALIKITEKPLILNTKSWIGNFSNNNLEQSIIVHDVLVSGRQIKESINKVDKNTEITAIFCLVNRLDYHGKQELEDEFNIPIYSLVDLRDEDIEKL